STDPRTGYHGLDSALVLSRLRLAADGGPALHPLADEPTPGQVNPYPSQFGLQGVVLSALMWALGAEPAPFAAAAALGCSLLNALTLALLFASAARRFRLAVGDVAVAVTASAPVLVQLAPSPHWGAF